ncbi:MAG: type I-E CRISPR-associated protein Cse2/CasB [Lautropia sp.]|nr:type I-E CRISPR-associated protein Cse2/CasB [Lautropia sp.]
MSIDQEVRLEALVGPKSRDVRYAALSAYVEHASLGERAALARLNPANLRPHQLSALSRALLAAEMSPEKMRHETWLNWALIAHGMALAGHDHNERLGTQLERAGIAEGRVNRLLAARGEAFRQMLPPLLRLMASKGVKPNWYELGELIVKGSSTQSPDREWAEDLRLRIAGAYFSALSKSTNTK